MVVKEAFEGNLCDERGRTTVPWHVEAKDVAYEPTLAVKDIDLDQYHRIID